MNERIRELADEAAEFIEAGPGSWTSDIFEQKFAELIVKECLSYMENGDIDFAKWMIKKEFGVKE